MMINSQRMISLAQQMIRFPSFSFEEADLASYLNEFLCNHGIDSTLQIGEISESRNLKQVVARITGNKPGRKALLSGHLDVMDVYRPDLWNFEPFGAEIVEGRLYGVGSLNMKAGLAALIEAVITFRENNDDFYGEIVLAGVAAEIIGGFGMQHLLKMEKDFDYAIIAEPTNLNICNISVGTSQGTIRIWGDTLYFKPHANPIYAMGQVLEAVGPGYGHLREDAWVTYQPCKDLPGFPRFNVRSIQSGQDFCEVFFDARLVPGQSNQSIQADLENLLHNLGLENDGYRVEISIPRNKEYSTFPPMPATDSSKDFILAMAKSFEATQHQIPIIGSGDRIGLASDSSHTKAAGIPSVDFGPGKHPRWPMVDEYVRIDDVIKCSQIVLETIQQLHMKEK